MESAWVCFERPRMARRHEPSDEERTAATFSIAGAEEGVDVTLGEPALVGIALTSEAAELWKSEGPRREIKALPLVGRSAASSQCERCKGTGAEPWAKPTFGILLPPGFPVDRSRR